MNRSISLNHILHICKGRQDAQGSAAAKRSRPKRAQHPEVHRMCPDRP